MKNSSPLKIFLIGMPGSGKSTLGHDLANVLQIPFVDLDREIEIAEGTTIREIFTKHGEGHFRAAETNQLKKLANSNDGFVMATGGGTPCFFDNIEIINRSGISLFLDVPVDEIARRVAREPLEERPMFANTSLERIREQVSAVRTARIHAYSKAHFTLSGTSISVSEIQDKIKMENLQ